MKMIDHNHFICHLILGTFTEYPSNDLKISGHFLYWMFRKELSYFAYFLQALFIDQLYLSAVDNN